MLILVFNSGFTHDKFSSSRGVLAALGSIIVYSGNSLAFYRGGITALLAKTGVRGGGIIISAVCGRILTIPKPLISYGSQMKRPSRSAR